MGKYRQICISVFCIFGIPNQPARIKITQKMNVWSFGYFI
jgi:hypothetical protein